MYHLPVQDTIPDIPWLCGNFLLEVKISRVEKRVRNGRIGGHGCAVVFEGQIVVRLGILIETACPQGIGTLVIQEGQIESGYPIFGVETLEGQKDLLREIKIAVMYFQNGGFGHFGTDFWMNRPDKRTVILDVGIVYIIGQNGENTREDHFRGEMVRLEPLIRSAQLYGKGN